MRIQLYDRGLPKGKQLFADIEAVCKRLQIDFDPEYNKDMNRVYSMGLQGSTILLINGEVALIDKYPSPKELENIISDYLD
ncbi:thioredoxin family protein [Patescibacteria group bacterium]|nr:thioredoxin family protein [Patescibacteria group bacterium]